MRPPYYCDNTATPACDHIRDSRISLTNHIRPGNQCCVSIEREQENDRRQALGSALDARRVRAPRRRAMTLSSLRTLFRRRHPAKVRFGRRAETWSSGRTTSQSVLTLHLIRNQGSVSLEIRLTTARDRLFEISRSGSNCARSVRAFSLGARRSWGR